MAKSCKQRQERIEETILQPIEQWVEQQEQRCRNATCIWWMLCLNKLVCWLVTVLVKVVLWVTTVVVRWVFRIVCTAVSLLVGGLALLVGNPDILVQAIKDLWELAKDAIYTVIGLVIFLALRIVDIIQSTVRLQPAKRPLTDAERRVLWPIFRHSLNYNAIRVVVGPAGLLGITLKPFTMGFTIYLPSYSVWMLVHECVHVWQFEFGGFGYIGNSALNQLDSMVFSPGYSPYDWQPHLDAGGSWYTLKSAEAQAKFIDSMYYLGKFNYLTTGISSSLTPGDFFQEDPALGQNIFKPGNDYTIQANDAWRIIRTG